MPLSFRSIVDRNQLAVADESVVVIAIVAITAAAFRSLAFDIDELLRDWMNKVVVA